jgi:hypothetical protein
MKMRLGASLAALTVLVGCDSVLEQLRGRGDPSVGLTAAPTADLPMDDRPVQTAAKPPPAISGGTLLVTADGRYAVAADPDRDRVSIVGLAEHGLIHTVALEPGDEPGRLAEDSTGRVHVALRRGGAVVTIEVATGAVVSRRAVCGAPRGIAYQAAGDTVHVACAGGELVSLPAAGGGVSRRVHLDVDLRDVVVGASGLLVSRFKSAELLQVSASGALDGRIALEGIQRASSFIKSPPSGPDPSAPQGGSEGEPVAPSVAWRTLAGPSGEAMVLHQYALSAVIQLPPKEQSPPASQNGGGSVSAPPGFSPDGAQQPYGAPPGGCGGLVQPALSRVDASGVVHMGMPLTAPVLSIDAALSPDGQWVALASAGTHDPDAPTFGGSSPGPTIVAPAAGQITLVNLANTVFPRIDLASGPAVPCAMPGSGFEIPGQAIAVAFNPRTDAAAAATNTWIVVQSREPAWLVLVRDPTGQDPIVVDLEGDSVFDTGHDLFHRDAGAGIACASCHVEGGEDGRVWRFAPLGDRRTQAVHVGLEGTAPFHWDGDMTDFETLMNEVLVRRMGGPRQSTARKDALQGYVFSLTPPASIVDPRDAAAQRGRALFESPEVGCTTCHSGPKFTNDLSVSVGTTASGHPMQVPSLHGVGYRAPFLHDGCAATLRERFDPSCGGGDLHGKTSRLAEVEIGDLVSYLQSL